VREERRAEQRGESARRHRASVFERGCGGCRAGTCQHPVIANAPRLLWEPSAAFALRTRMRAYMDWLAARHGVRAVTYDELWRWSIDDVDAFWSSIAE
jgi:hypothetical protein